MKFLLTGFLLVWVVQLNAQIPKSGNYIYNYCDEEYNKCMGKCKITIIGNKVWIYAPANLTGIKEGELYEKGILLNHKSGKWFVKESNKTKNPKIIGGCVGPTWFDFKRKRFWAC